jgi:hypothetical protein
MDYMRAQLTDGGPLAMQHLGHLEEGAVWEFVTENSPAQPLPRQLLEARYDAYEAWDLRQEYVSFLCDYLQQDSSRILLFENQFFRMNDPCMLNRDTLFEWEGVTYFYFPSNGVQVSQSAVEAALPRASHYPYIVLATQRTFDEELPIRGLLTGDRAVALGEHVQHILVGAYDEEAYVMWSRVRD